MGIVYFSLLDDDTVPNAFVYVGNTNFFFSRLTLKGTTEKESNTRRPNPSSMTIRYARGPKSMHDTLQRASKMVDD